MFDVPVSAVAGITLGVAFVLLFFIGKVHAATARCDAKLDALLKHSGIDPVAMAMDAAAKLAREGKKIEAIKKLRELTGCGLAEAKQKVEDMV